MGDVSSQCGIEQINEGFYSKRTIPANGKVHPSTKRADRILPLLKGKLLKYLNKLINYLSILSECTWCENLAKTYHKNKLISYHEK